MSEAHDTLTDFHLLSMVSHMKTTLEIDDNVMRELKARAARDGTMSALVESALRLLLRSETSPKKLAPLPTWNGGAPLVGVAERVSPYRVARRRNRRPSRGA